MKIENYLNLNGRVGISGLFFACGDFGVIDGDAEYARGETDDGVRYVFDNGNIRLTTEFCQYEGGMVIRRDHFENLTDSAVTVNKLHSRFHMDGNSYEVYTQFNGWQHESEGAWQKLVTQVTAASEGVRTCEGAAPVMALYNEYSGISTVFHLLPNAQWRMTVRKHPLSDKEHVIVEMGFEDSGMHFEVLPGEKVDLPEIIFFNTDDRVGLGAHRLHALYNKLYPRKKMPVLYNSWLCTFDKLNADILYSQVDAAAELGVEAFMIDAGWFGTGDASWYELVGDWEENPGAIGRGGLTALSEYVRSKGMIFGLWFEPERAEQNSRAYTENPGNYIPEGNMSARFLDFSNKAAVDTIFNTVVSNIEKYNIGWVKFDFNSTIPYDSKGSSFYRYMQGNKDFVMRLRERFPELYITNCASGGMRMDLGQGRITDSFWISDNEGAQDELEIIKNSLKRLPSQLIERWGVLMWCEGFPWYDHMETRGLIGTCRGAVWDNVEIVSEAHTRGFMTGGPMGFSCDIASFPKDVKDMFKKHIENFKKEREFYLKVNARILIDTESIVAIEYADTELSRAIVLVFTKTTHASELLLRPALDKTACYEYNGEKISGAEAMEDGILMDEIRNNDCLTLEFKKI